MNRIEDMLRDPSMRPSHQPGPDLADRVASSIEGEPDPPPTRRPTAAIAAAGLVVVLIVGASMWPRERESGGFAGGDPRVRIIEDLTHRVTERDVQTSVAREVILMKGDAEAVLRELRSSLSRM